MSAHAKHMAAGGFGILGLLIVLGVSSPWALTWALLLACPIGMIGMMWFMSRRTDARQDPGAREGTGHHAYGTHATAHPPAGVPAQRAHDR